MEFEARRFLAVADVADVLGITPAAVAELLESGELRGLRVRGAWRIPDDEVQAWIDRELELARRRGLWRQAQAASITDLFGGR
ncbi:MAG: helix-turn-helix domain-containing protein [Actinomycetota bacterium]